MVRPPIARLQELARFALVGGVASLLHGGLLLALARLGLPLSLANLTGFLAASLWGYLAHALFTFRRQTGGRRFSRRWLVLQLVVNLALSLALPTLLGAGARRPFAVLLMVFTPTAVNLVIWKLAARHVASRSEAIGAGSELPAIPRCHADDLGLDGAVNGAIFALHDRGCLQGASLLLNGPALAEARAGLEHRPDLALCLHLCLTEGPPLADPVTIPLLLDRHGHLRAGFGRLLMASWLPRRLPWRRQLERQLDREIRAQIRAFQQIRPGANLALDGHQHIHLVPIVLERLLALEPGCRPCWLRRLREPLPAGLGPAAWLVALGSGGLFKWLLLRGLDRLQAHRMEAAGIAANGAFAGVLFTGRMAGAPLQAAWRQLTCQPAVADARLTPLLLLHPSLPGRSVGSLRGFAPSQVFYASPWRWREYEALVSLSALAESPLTLRMK